MLSQNVRLDLALDEVIELVGMLGDLSEARFVELISEAAAEYQVEPNELKQAYLTWKEESTSELT